MDMYMHGRAHEIIYSAHVQEGEYIVHMCRRVSIM